MASAYTIPMVTVASASTTPCLRCCWRWSSAKDQTTGTSTCRTWNCLHHLIPSAPPQGWPPNEVHTNRLSCLPLAIFEHRYARGHQSLARDYLEYCDLATDRQRRAYALVRETTHALTTSHLERRNSVLSKVLKEPPLPIYTIGGWVCMYGSTTTPPLSFARAQGKAPHPPTPRRMVTPWPLN